MDSLSIKSARKIALKAQLLDSSNNLPEGREGIAQVIEKLGYIQIDTISVVEWAHHHTLWTRPPDYNPDMLYKLQAEDHRIFEYWGHAASYLPVSDYRYYLPQMKAYNDPKKKWVKQRFQKYGQVMDLVLERIRKEGPLCSKDFVSSSGEKRSTWWDWKPAKAALELLFWKGDLMITERRNFQKIYDLTERVLPESVDTTVPDENELGRFLVHRALSAYGIAVEKEIRNHINSADKEVIKKAIIDLVDAGEVERFFIEEQGKSTYYSLTETIKKPLNYGEKREDVFILSPFDNLIIQRDRTRRLFSFDYALECYVPAVKRKFGYFVLPVLWGNRFVARLDAKADRKKKALILRNLIFEPEFIDYNDFILLFAEKLWDFARFNKCDNIEIETVVPAKTKPVLIKYLK